MIRTAPAPLFALSRLVRQSGIKVVLTGEGADEVFGGYNIFKEDKIRRFMARRPDSAARALLLGKLYPYIMRESRGINPFWTSFFKKDLQKTDSPFYSHAIRWDNTSKMRTLFDSSIKSLFSDGKAYPEIMPILPSSFNTWHHLNRAQFLEIGIFMSGYLLSSQGDRMMMGNSVEGRFPFLDHRVMKFASQLPPEFKINGLNEKYILKTTFKDFVPLEIIKRAKQPYRAPIRQVFLDKDTPQLMQHLLSPEALNQYGYYNTNMVSKLTRKLAVPGVAAAAKDEMALNAIASLQLLHYHFVENFDNHTFDLASRSKIVNTAQMVKNNV